MRPPHPHPGSSKAAEKIKRPTESRLMGTINDSPPRYPSELIAKPPILMDLCRISNASKRGRFYSVIRHQPLELLLCLIWAGLLADLVEYLVDRIKQLGGRHFGYVQREESLG
jgi:hypothetical protein